MRKSPLVYSLLLSLLLALNFLQAQEQAQVLPIQLEVPEVNFTDPSLICEEQNDSSIAFRIVQLIQATPPKAEISVSMFKFDLDLIADALIDAHNRGVWVQVIIDHGKTSIDVNAFMQAKLEKQMDKFYAFNNAIKKKAIIHTKYIMFSKVITTQGPREHIVAQTSTNFQQSGLRKLQDLVVISDEKIYFGYHTFWHQLETLGRLNLLGQYEYFHEKGSDEDYKAYFFPKRKNEKSHGKDNVVKILEDIEDPASAHLRFAIGKWEGNRMEVVHALENLGTAGASIEVSISKSDGEEVIDSLRAIPNCKVNVLKKSEARTHLKYFMIDALYQGSRQQIVWTGSANFTKKSLRSNFEAILEMRKKAIYDQYLAHFKTVMTID